MNMIEIIKRAAVDAVNSSYPTQVIFARVASTSPLQVYISQKMPNVGAPLLVVSATAAKANLAVGDKVILLRAQGGQQFIVLDKEG